MPNCIKGARLEGQQASGPGYVLFGEAAPGREQTMFAFEVTTSPISFLFGFTGVGCHYLCEILTPEKTVALYQIRDGIPIYLQHVRVEISKSSRFAILWNDVSIRVRLDGFTVINVLAEGTQSGHWGFSIPHGTRSLPEVITEISPRDRWEWVCLGDGFSNNRWRNRDFLCWPELVFGGESNCLNACVGAGNTIRVAAVTEKIAASLPQARVIIASGSDDLMEGSSFEAYAQRIKTLVASLHQYSCGGITLATLPPRVSDRKSTAEWSKQIKSLAKQLETEIFDFHDWLVGDLDKYMVHGEYPGARAQEEIAERIAFQLGRALPTPPRPPSSSENPHVVRFARKIERALGRWTLDYPGMIR